MCASNEKLQGAFGAEEREEGTLKNNDSPRHVRNFNDSRSTRRDAERGGASSGPSLVHLCGVPREIIRTSEGARRESMTANRRNRDWHTAERSEIRSPVSSRVARVRVPMYVSRSGT